MTDTRERAAARKRAERERKRAAGIQKIELNLDADELEMLQRNCALRRPGRDPYDMDEYIQMLIRQDDARVKLHIKSISRMKCKKCGDRLPVSDCCLSGDADCWNTRGWQAMKISI
ncbi:MAG: hypothetical protein ABN480_14410 [Dickeya sp.]